MYLPEITESFELPPLQVGIVFVGYSWSVRPIVGKHLPDPGVDQQRPYVDRRIVAQKQIQRQRLTVLQQRHEDADTRHVLIENIGVQLWAGRLIAAQNTGI